MSLNPGNWYKLDEFLHTTFVVKTVPNVVQNRITNRIGEICRVNVVGSPGLVFMGRDSRSQGRGFKSGH